jgi:hypothetical protein
MPPRTSEEIRAQIAAERQALAADMDALRGEVRSFKPVAVAGAAAVGLVAAAIVARLAFKIFR